MNTIKSKKNSDALASIAVGRKRTNLLHKSEQQLIAFFVQRLPAWLSPNLLTVIGLIGNLIVFLSFILATYIHATLLLISILGFAISWFGDSLDGRVAYYRKIPRKWYGFTLDLTVDWIGIIIIGIGFMIYIEPAYEMIVYAFIVLYGWEMITALLRYKITGNYSIDAGIMGPTEVRILISAILIVEVLLPGSIVYIGAVVVLGLLFSNILEFIKILKLADARDKEEKGEIRKNA